jgi:hypothetical protein
LLKLKFSVAFSSSVIVNVLTVDGQVPIVEANDAAELLVPENDDLIPEKEKINYVTKSRGTHILNEDVLWSLMYSCSGIKARS